MGADDADEGPGQGCAEHVWRLAGVTLADDGAHSDFECRCGAVMVVGPGGVLPG